jgi:FAD-dependent oxidoreductase family protein
MESCDVLIVGGGCGGVAAALAAARLGLRVVLSESSRWVGGQLTTQAVPPDEHPWVEWTGTTQTYRELRERVRRHYRDTRPLTDAARSQRDFNPGQAWVSNLSAEPPVFLHELMSMLAPWQLSGQLRVVTSVAPVAAEVDDDVVRAVMFAGPAAETWTVSAPVVLDATEEGDLLPLTGCEHVIGAESADDTGELHAPAGADTTDQQAITWCLALEARPGEEHVIDPPASYDFWRSYQPPHWPGPQLGWVTPEPETGRPIERPLFDPGQQDLWSFRRIRYAGHYRAGVTDVTVVNWPQVDYWLSPVLGVEPEERQRARQEARELSLSFVHWLQTEAPRPDGGAGYPWLRLCPDILGSPDGLAQAPYIRESRRILSQFKVLEQHIGVQARPDADRAEEFPDTVGVGCYRIDLHPSTSGRGYLDIATYPFQIPLGALLPQRIENLLAAGKALGVTHITNGCYRLHPVEWNVGEAAGALAAFSLDRGVPPGAVRERPRLLHDFQAVLESLGVQLHWPPQIQPMRR